MATTIGELRTGRERVAAALARLPGPIRTCPACEGLADHDGRCLLRCDRDPIRPAVTIATMIGLAMMVR